MSTLLTPEHYTEIKSRYARFNEPWTAKEIEDLHEIVEYSFTVDEMATHLGRTPNSIRMKLKELGLTAYKPAPRRWTEDEDNKLVKMYCKGDSFDDMALYFCRTENAIISRLVRLRAGLLPSPTRQE